MLCAASGSKRNRRSEEEEEEEEEEECGYQGRTVRVTCSTSSTKGK
jgi:hypothetical protein